MVLNVEGGVEDVVSVPLEVTVIPPPWEHRTFFTSRFPVTFPVSWLVTPPDVNWTPELDLPLTSSLTSPKWNPLPNTSLAALPRSPYVGGAILSCRSESSNKSL